MLWCHRRHPLGKGEASLQILTWTHAFLEMLIVLLIDDEAEEDDGGSSGGAASADQQRCPFYVSLLNQKSSL